jgi:hypothetical protein
MLASSVWDSALLGVLIGGAITLAATFGLEWWRARREDAQAAETKRRTTLQAIRLVLEELAESAALIEGAVKTGSYWTDGNRQLPTSTWNVYREALALHVEIYEWRITASAYHALNDLNWDVRSIADVGSIAWVPEPRRAEQLRDAWRAVRHAMAVLDSLTGPRGAFGYTGYVEEDELERSIWG